MKKSLILLAATGLLASCGGTVTTSSSSSASSASSAASSSSASVSSESSSEVSSEASSEEYDIAWVTPTGIPTLAFYDQGANANWISSSTPATVVVPSFANDNQDFIVFDGTSGLTNIAKNSRNYQLARWISEGSFYVCSVKHDSPEDFVAGATVDAFVKTGNASKAFLKLAKDNWNWGDYSEAATFEDGVATVKDNLVSNPEGYDFYVLAEPVVTAVKGALAKQGKTLNVIYDLQEEWATYYDGGQIPAAALFVNKTSYANHKDACDAFMAETEERIANAIDNPSVAAAALTEYEALAAENDGLLNCQGRFGFVAAQVTALQADGANKFSLLKLSDVEDNAKLANDFMAALGGSAFDSSLFLS